jgi:hypothetical protein
MMFAPYIAQQSRGPSVTNIVAAPLGENDMGYVKSASGVFDSLR